MTSRHLAVFVHGINNNLNERLSMKDNLDHLCSIYNVSDILPDGLTPITWESTGDFMMDLMILKFKPDRTEMIFKKIAKDILDAQSQIIQKSLKDEFSPNMTLMGHSIGQLLLMLAVNEITAVGGFQIPFSILTMGGPLGNNALPFEVYLEPYRRIIEKCDFYKDDFFKEFVDIYNEDDPIPYSKLPMIASFPLPLNLPKIPFLGYSKFLKIVNSIKFDFPGKPSFDNPLEEHGSYFKHPFCFTILRKLFENLDETSIQHYKNNPWKADEK